MTFLSPADLCHLGATSRYWRAMVRDPLLWRYFLLRDMPFWPSIDHVTIPHPDLLDAPLISEDESLDDREEGNEGIKLKFDYMSEWVSPCYPALLSVSWKIFWANLVCQQIPERLPILQTAVASYTTSIWGGDLIFSVPGTLVWTSLCHVWSWHGAAGCLFSHKAYVCSRYTSCVRHSTQTDKW